MLVAIKTILNPKVAKIKFEEACKTLVNTSVTIPPSTDWQIVYSSFPLLKIEISVDDSPRICLILDCTNYDYEGPIVRYENLKGDAVRWAEVRKLVLEYPGKINNQPRMINDVILYPDGEGLVCRIGNEAYHQLHPETNWREVRTQDQGKLEFIIDSSVRLFDPEKLKEFGETS